MTQPHPLYIVVIKTPVNTIAGIFDSKERVDRYLRQTDPDEEVQVIEVESIHINAWTLNARDML